jgi:hypothetical protein
VRNAGHASGPSLIQVNLHHLALSGRMTIPLRHLAACRQHFRQANPSPFRLLHDSAIYKSFVSGTSVALTRYVSDRPSEFDVLLE